jgi:signal transduction histidine kinase
MVERLLNREGHCCGLGTRDVHHPCRGIAHEAELVTLTRISDIALGHDTPEAACQRIADEISTATRFPVVVIERYDDVRQVMVLQGATGIPADHARTAAHEVPLDGAISRSVVQTRQPLVQEGTCDRAADIWAAMRQLGTQTFVCVPMLVGTRVLGALSLGHPDHLPEVDRLLPWLSSLANFVATLIERRRAEHHRLELLREQAARVRAEAAIQARDEFLSVAAHELRTPVAALRAYSQLLARRLDQLDSTDARLQLRDGIATFAEQTEKLALLLGELMDVSRLGAGKLVIELRECDLAAIVRDVVAVTRPLAPGHRILLDAPASLVTVIDALRIEQVLSNLLSNAMRYSPAGGDIEVQLTRRAGAGLRLAVRDHGPGIPPEHRARIFDRFYQADPDASCGGLGLGLYISGQIVEQHGGRLDVETPDDGGTCFVVTLPR